MRHYRLNPVETLEEMRRRLELQADEEGTLLAYLDKMHYPLWITQFYENISQVTEAIVDAAAAAGVTTLELRYSPDHPHLRRPHARASRSAPCSPG